MPSLFRTAPLISPPEHSRDGTPVASPYLLRRIVASARVQIDTAHETISAPISQLAITCQTALHQRQHLTSTAGTAPPLPKLCSWSKDNIMGLEEKQLPTGHKLNSGPPDIDYKGKGKQTTTETSSTDPSSGQTLVSRITTSATALAKEMVGNRANASDISQIITANKGGSSTSATATTTSGLSGTVQSSSTSSYVPTNGDNLFKTSDTQSHVAQQESAFSSFLDGVPTLEPPNEVPSVSSFEGDPVSHKENQQQDSTQVAGGSLSDNTGPITDGLAVVELLDSGAYEEVMAEVADDPILDPDEERSLRRALFGSNPEDQTTKDVDWNDLLNFLPSYIASEDLSRQHERLGHLGTSDASDSHRMWVEQWQDVLTRYTGEVWGDLGSLVREAQKELQQADPGPITGAGPSDFPALRRLQQVLGHVRGH